MLEDNTKNICEPYIGVAKKCLNLMGKEDMLVNDIDKVYECMNYLIRFSKLNF